MNIAEGLAEIKLLKKRITSRLQFVGQHVIRYKSMMDPLAKKGGSTEIVGRARQSVADMRKRIIDIRCAIARTNDVTTAEVAGFTKTISAWLVWKREIVDGAVDELETIVRHVKEHQRIAAGDPEKDVEAHVDMVEVQRDLERYQTAKARLDAKLSVINATTDIGIASFPDDDLGEAITQP